MCFLSNNNLKILKHLEPNLMMIARKWKSFLSYSTLPLVELYILQDKMQSQFHKKELHANVPIKCIIYVIKYTTFSLITFLEQQILLNFDKVCPHTFAYLSHF